MGSYATGLVLIIFTVFCCTCKLLDVLIHWLSLFFNCSVFDVICDTAVVKSLLLNLANKWFAIEYIEGAMLTIAMLLYKIGSNASAMLAPRAKAAN